MNNFRGPRPITRREMQAIVGDRLEIADWDAVSEELVTELAGKLGQTFRMKDELMALCPFHDDKTLGSFYLNLTNGVYYCWSCQAKGNLVRLANKLQVGERGDFRGVSIERLTEHIVAGMSRGRDDIPMELLPVLPESVLDHVEPLNEWRGHWLSTLRRLEVGYDPLFNRVVFPVRTHRGGLVGIQSRALSPHAKLRWKFYRSEFRLCTNWDEHNIVTLLNYEVPRASVFYGETVSWNWFNPDSKSTKPLVLCEGPGHALRILEAGYPCLATFGTSVSNMQVSRLRAALRRRHKGSVVLCYDGDAAGRRAVGILEGQMPHYVDVRIAELPEGKDPEDLDVVSLAKVLEEAKPSYYRRLSEDWEAPKPKYIPREYSRQRDTEEASTPTAPERWVNAEHYKRKL